MEKTAHYKLVQETKNTGKYGETDSRGAVIEDFRGGELSAVIYVKKSVFGGSLPKEVDITFNWK